MKIRKAVFPIAGWGTRFLPVTKVIPKSMLPIIDKPIIQYAVEEAVYAGIEHIIFIANSNTSSIEDYFSRSLELESFLESKDKTDLLNQIREISSLAYFSSTRSSLRGQMPGLGAAVLSAKNIVGDEPFAVVLPNDLIDSKVPCLHSLVKIYEELSFPILAMHKVSMEEVSTYGNIGFAQLDQKYLRTLNGDSYVREKIAEVKRLIQKPDPNKNEHYSDFAIIGRYILTPEIFPVLEKLDPGYEGEVQLTDALEALRNDGYRIHAYQFEGKYYDTRSKEGYVKAIINFAMKDQGLADCINKIFDLAQ